MEISEIENKVEAAKEKIGSFQEVLSLT